MLWLPQEFVHYNVQYFVCAKPSGLAKCKRIQERLTEERRLCDLAENTAGR